MSQNNNQNSTFTNTQSRLLVQSIIDYAIYVLSPTGVIVEWNAGAEKLYGYAAAQIIGQHFSCLYFEKPEEGELEKFLQSVLIEGTITHERMLVRKEGGKFWGNVVVNPIYDIDGLVIGFVSVVRDITAQKKAIDELHVEEERFRLLVSGVTDYAIYMLSPEGMVSNWNTGANRIKGYTDSEVIGTHFSRFYTQEDQQKGFPLLALNTAKTDGRFESEGWRVRKDGSKFWAHVIIDRITSDAGDLIGFAKITRDVTEKRAAAASLEKAQLALFQAQKMDSIGQLTGGVAHDFNNLLSVISNGLAILQHRLNDAQNKKILDSMQRATDQGAGLIRQLLTFASQQPTDPKPQHLNDIILSFEPVLRKGAGKAKLKVELGATPKVLVDASLFEAALLNLIVNARDASMADGGIRLETSTVTLANDEINSLPAGKYVKVSVIDNGSGIPAEIISKIVEPFFTTKPVGKGTGLGLSQVFGFVKQSNGDLIISSVPNVQTQVEIYLPALADGVSEVDSSDIIKAERALVVDDQPEVLDMAGQLFGMLGYDVVSAPGGEEALTLIERHPDISILFSDIVMPGMSGIELAKKARSFSPKLKILLASGYSGSSLVAQNNKLEDFRFISKPYKLADIAKLLRSL